MSATPSSLFGRTAGAGSPQRPRRHLLLKILLVLIVLCALLVAGLSWYASTPEFANKVRTELIKQLETATGGRVELGAFRWRLMHLEFEADNLTIHGLEAPGEVPYAHLDRLMVHVKIISFFRARVGLNYLGVDRPTIHIIVYKDGSTNQPSPKQKSTTPLDVNKTIDEIFDLQANRVEVNDGIFLLNQKAMPFSLAANDLEVGINYLPPSDSYQAAISIADLSAQRGKNPALHSKLSITALMQRDNLNVSDLHFSAGASTLAAHANVSHFADPHWTASAKGTVDLREAEAVAGIPGLDRGVVAIDAAGKGTKALFSVDGSTTVADATYRGSGIYIDGLDASAKFHADQDLLAATNLRAKLKTGGVLTADAHIDHWLSTATPAPAPTTNPVNAKAAATVAAARGVGQAVSQATSNDVSKSQVSVGAVHAELSGFTLPSILSIIAPPKLQHLGFDTVAGGKVDLKWTGDASDLSANADVALRAPAKIPNGDVPLDGLISVAYAGRTSSLLVHQLNLHTPGTTVQASGGVGLAAGAKSALQLQASASNLGEFDKALAAFGVKGKNGASAIPVALHGTAGFNGVVTGSLAAPNVTGHAAVQNFDVLMNQLEAASPVTPTNPSGKAVPVPQAATGTPGTTAANAPPFHVDALTADFSYSPQKVQVQSALITRGPMQVHLSGQLTAHRTRRKGYVFDNDAGIAAQASVTNANIPDLLTLAGQGSVPLTGTLQVNAHVGGTLGDLNGGGSVTVAGGQAYGEAYKNLNVQLQFAGQDVGASSLSMGIAGGTISGNGGYNLKSQQFHFGLQAQGIDLDKLEAVKKSPLVVHGLVSLNAKGSGTPKTPSVTADAHLTGLSIANPAGGPASTGRVDLTARTANGNLAAQMNATLGGATANLTANTAMSGDFNTQARLTIAQLDVNPYLAMFNMDSVKGDSVLSGAVTVNGPLAKPKQLSGTANLSQIKISSQGVSLGTDGALQAQLKNGYLSLQPLHITGTGTDIRVRGRAGIFSDDKALNAAAVGTIDLKVAHTFVPDLSSSGTVTFDLTAGNTVQKPDLEGSAKFNDVNLAYGDFPNGLSHLNGTLAFDEGRLTLDNLQGTSGGGKLTFGGFVTYQQGVYADLTINASQVRIRYPVGVSTMIDSKIRVQGTLESLLVSGGVNITRFTIFPNVDLSSFSSNGVSPPPDPTAFGNKIRLDVHVTSSQQLEINNSYAKLAGDVDLFVRGTAEDPSILGHISMSEGSASFGGTSYTLQHGDIYFTNPVRIEPTLDIEASAHVEDYDIIIGLHGTTDKLTPTFRSEPPLSEQDIFSLLALGKTQEEAAIYSEQQSQAGVNSTADALLGGALNATVTSRINKLFGGGSVKIDPTVVDGTGNSTARITVQQQIGKNLTVTYATNVNSTAQQLIQGQYNFTPNLSLLAVRDESGVFSMEILLHRRYR